MLFVLFVDVDIPNGGQSASIELLIVDDNVPELNEVLFVSLDAVTLISGQLNTSIVNGRTVDIPPVLGSLVISSVTISANDDPHGVIEFDRDSSLVDTSENVGVLTLTLVRKAGTFGVISVMYEAVNRTAVGLGVDYSVGVAGRGIIQFVTDQTSATLDVAVIDDGEPELQEAFEIRLSSPQGGARLGDDDTALITISANDDPSGIVGFNDGLLAGVVVNNPSVAEGNRQVNLTVSRTAGDVGRIEVRVS